MYTDLPYDVHTVTVKALSDSSNVTIVQKGSTVINYIKYINCIVILNFLQC